MDISLDCINLSSISVPISMNESSANLSLDNLELSFGSDAELSFSDVPSSVAVSSGLVSDHSEGWESHGSALGVRSRGDDSSSEELDMERTPRKRPPKRSRTRAATTGSHTRADQEGHVTGLLAAFQVKIRAMDASAEFDKVDSRRVRCSRCAQWVTMRVPHEVRRFEEHRATDRCQIRGSSPVGRTNTLLAFGFTVRAGPAAVLRRSNRTFVQRDCPGLTTEVEPLIDQYLRRTGVPGGGARSRQRIVDELYPGRSWERLSEAQQKLVARRETATFRWLNNHHLMAVYAQDCRRLVDVDAMFLEAPTPPCSRCMELLNDRGFRNRLRQKAPEVSNARFVPRRYQSAALLDLYASYAGLRQLMEAVSVARLRSRVYWLILLRMTVTVPGFASPRGWLRDSTRTLRSLSGW